MNAELTEIQCPTCFEFFSIPLPAVFELPTTLDYDCEICCRPMFVHIDDEGQSSSEPA